MNLSPFSARQVLPGGVDSPVRAFTSVGSAPLFIKRAAGARLYDVDGNSFIDIDHLPDARGLPRQLLRADALLGRPLPPGLPLAAVLTMGGYSIAFGVATWLFATPALCQTRVCGPVVDVALQEFFDRYRVPPADLDGRIAVSPGSVKSFCVCPQAANQFWFSS